MAVTLTALINAIGDENLRFQNLDHSLINADWTARKGAKITFGTEETITPNGPDKLGLILWLDRTQVAEVMARLKAEA